MHQALQQARPCWRWWYSGQPRPRIQRQNRQVVPGNLDTMAQSRVVFVLDWVVLVWPDRLYLERFLPRRGCSGHAAPKHKGFDWMTMRPWTYCASFRIYSPAQQINKVKDNTWAEYSMAKTNWHSTKERTGHGVISVLNATAPENISSNWFLIDK